MHCDQVYAILTRGPFPSGEVTDVAVEIHLAHCADCRRLAEALRPLERATEVTADAAQLPGYRGDHPEWRQQHPQHDLLSPVAHWRAPPRRIPRPLTPLRLGGLMATVLFGIAVGFLLSAATATRAPAPSGGLAMATFGGSGRDDWGDARFQAQLVYGLKLPRACIKLNSELFVPLSSDERSPANLFSQPPSFVNQCCTQCHVAGGRTQVGPSQRSKLILSCGICHNESTRSRW